MNNSNDWLTIRLLIKLITHASIKLTMLLSMIIFQVTSYGEIRFSYQMFGLAKYQFTSLNTTQTHLPLTTGAISLFKIMIKMRSKATVRNKLL